MRMVVGIECVGCGSSDLDVHVVHISPMIDISATSGRCARLCISRESSRSGRAWSALAWVIGRLGGNDHRSALGLHELRGIFDVGVESEHSLRNATVLKF